MTQDEMEYKELANAIILQAVKDYEKDYTDLKKLIDKQENEHQQRYLRHCLEKIDLFFDGEWCASLSRDDVSRSWAKKRSEIRERIGEVE